MKFFTMMSRRNQFILLLTLSYCLIQVSCQEKPSKSKKSGTPKPNNQLTTIPERTHIKIRDQQDLKEHGKRLIRNLMKNSNAKAVLTCLATDVRTILENRYASDVIVKKMHIIKDVLRNHDAKVILKHFTLKVAAYFVSDSTVKICKDNYTKYKTYLSDEKIPVEIKKNSEKVQDILQMPMVRKAIVSVKNLAIDYIKGPNLKERIAKGFTSMEQMLKIAAIGFK